MPVNKGGYLKSFTKDIKPSIIQKHQVFVADFFIIVPLLLRVEQGGREISHCMHSILPFRWSSFKLIIVQFNVY